jgi:hypothetical protein
MRIPAPGSSGGTSSVPHAGELFTDRESESRAFALALASFRRALDHDGDVGIARNNVLAFYGMGGIGKSALSERLEAWVAYDLPLENGWGPPPPTKVAGTARIDLHGSAGQIDISAALLALRSGLAHIRRRWPVFDLAFAAYWSAAHPGEPLPSIRGRDELTSSLFDSAKDLIGDLGSVADLATGTGAGIGVRIARKVVGDVRRRRDLRLAMDVYDGFESFLLRCADEPSPTEPQPTLACDLAATLAWELATMNPCPLVTVFIDTTERLALDPRRVSERHLSTLIHRMPNVLFVLTGRDMLDWHDETRADLDHHGPWVWPGLVPGARDEPRQHLVGNLSPSDTRTLILRGRRKLGLPLPDSVVGELVTASAGLPQYLELARQVAVSIKNAGGDRHVTVADVTGSLASLVRRILDDIPADEQRAIRAACLFRVFDTGLIAAAAAVDNGCAERAVGRPMIDRFEGERFPYRMHDAVREAIRRTDHQVAGGWSEPDWELAAGRAATAAKAIHDRAKEREDDGETLDAIGITIGLVCDQETALDPSPSSTYADWLSRAIVYSPSIQGLRSRVPGSSRTGYGRHVLNFITAKSIETPVDERLTLLREIFDSDHPLRLPAGRHLGYTLKLQRRWDDAIGVFDEVIRLAPTPLNIDQVPQVLSMARRFIDAREAAEAAGNTAHTSRVTEYAHGRPERYFAEIGNKLTKLRGAGRQREYLEEMGDYLLRRALLRESLGRAEIEEFRDTAELAGHIVAVRSALLAAALNRQGGQGDVTLALERLNVLGRTSPPVGEVGFRFAMGEFCDALLANSTARLRELHGVVSGVATRTRSWIPVECFFASIGMPLAPEPTQWIEPYAVVQQRWAAHLDAYLARHRAV